MPEVTRVTRSYRDGYGYGYGSDDDDDHSTISHSRAGDGSYRTVQRYRVTPSRTEDIEIDRRSTTRLDIPRVERIEIDRRSERFIEPERPRSAIDIRSPRSTFTSERYIEREPIREPERERARTRTVVYERDRREPERSTWDRGPARSWESERDVRETDLVRVEKRITERREEPYELERYQRETEYYDRPEAPPQPIIIRQRAPEPQQIIVQEAPAPPPIVLPPREQEFQVVRQTEVQQEVARPEPRRTEDEYYYRKDVREVGPVRRNEEEFVEYDRRDVRPRDSASDREYSDREDYVMKRKVIRRERSRSGSPHHRRHLAEGALAGAGAAALLANHRSKTGDGDGGHRGRNLVGGAALGAIGAEVITRARSRYRESRGSRSSTRSRSSSRHSHRNIRTALGLAAAGLAAAAAAKYVSDRKVNKEEMGRGRSRTRSVSRRRRSYDYDSYDEERPRSRSRSKNADPKHRAATIAKAGAATAAVAGVVEHFRSRSRKRSGSRSKSKSRVRTGAELAGVGLAGAAVAGLYENRKAKEDRDLEVEEDHKRERRRSRSRARSRGAYSDSGVDPELGLVQYGTEPVYTHQQTTAYQRGYDDDPALAAGGAGAAYGATKSRSRSYRRRHSSNSDDRRRSRSRSRSRVRNIAGAAAGTAAAAIGINQYKKRKEKVEMDRERERRRYEEEPAPEENYYARDYQDDYSPSPPHASGGSYYPQNNAFPPQPEPQPGFTAHTTTSTIHVNHEGIPPYNPADYSNQPPHPEPYGYSPQTGPNVSANEHTSQQAPFTTPVPMPTTSRATPYFPPPPVAPLLDEQSTLDPFHAEEGGVNSNLTPRAHSPASTISPFSLPPLSPSRPLNKSVNFAPLSPTSSRRLAHIRETAAATNSNTHVHDVAHPDLSPTPSDFDTPGPSALVRFLQPRTQIQPRDRDWEPDGHHDREPDGEDDQPSSRHRRSRRRNSDPSSNRPIQLFRNRRRHQQHSRSPSPTSSAEIEVLPDRFGRDGRPLDRYGRISKSRDRGRDDRDQDIGGDRANGGLTGLGGLGGLLGGAGGGQTEMVEKLATGFGEIMEGRKSWKDLLRGFLEESWSAGVSPSGPRERERDSNRGRERRRRVR